MASKIGKVSLRYFGEIAHCDVCCDGAVVMHLLKSGNSAGKGPIIVSAVAGTWTHSTLHPLEMKVLGGLGSILIKGQKPQPVKPGAIIQVPAGAVFTYKLKQPSQFHVTRVAGPGMGGPDDEDCVLR